MDRTATAAEIDDDLLPVFNMGRVRILGQNLDKAWALADLLEDEEVARKTEGDHLSSFDRH